VYQGYIQFVQLSLTGCRLASHTINIPNSLLNITEDSDLKSRIRSTCRLVDDTSAFSRNVKAIEAKVKKLRDDFVKPLGKRYGSVILRKLRPEFDKRVSALREELELLSKAVKVELGNEINSSREQLVAMLLPGLMKNPPQKLLSELQSGLNEGIAKEFIGEELDREIPEVERLIGEMQLNCDYKDVTFDMLTDKAFIDAIEEKYKRANFSKLYSEQETLGQR
jgi:hypothetical protein